MQKLILSITCLIAALIHPSTSTNIECDFTTTEYSALGFIYECEVSNNPSITSASTALITEITGTHQASKNNDKVFGFSAKEKNFQVFPKGLEKFFKNLRAIFIHRSELKAIHQSDLKVFPNLVFLNFQVNKIEVIEKDLFKFNSKLEVVGFNHESNIVKIDPNVFDNLSKLRYFWFDNVPCVNQYVDDSRQDVLKAIKVVKSKCSE